MDKSTLVRIGGGVTAMLMFQSGKPRWRLHTKHLLIQPSYIHRWSQKSRGYYSEGTCGHVTS